MNHMHASQKKLEGRSWKELKGTQERAGRKLKFKGRKELASVDTYLGSYLISKSQVTIDELTNEI